MAAVPATTSPTLRNGRCSPLSPIPRAAVLVEKWRHAGSNNIAELWAVHEALTWAVEHGHDAIEIRTDSTNKFAWVAGRIGKKLNDRAAVLDLYETIRRLREQVRLELVWVPREENLAGHYIEAKTGL